ncbi:MAG: amino acid adenylation domain-containing protein, partial [bacterium]|nr:amino acid adenylation domain-containing protein [bacterium]
LRRVLAELPGCTVINGYGPTESTTFTHCAPMRSPGAVADSVSIGRPITNTRAYVLDRQLRPAPVGVFGELHIAGDGLARGYLNRPSLTAASFVPSPLGEVPGERLYRTGDLVRTLADGRLEFLGRRDHQVKVRGFRIELGEVETALGSHPAVRESVVVAMSGDAAADRRLVAYIVAQGEGVAAGELREFLRRSLPEYMMPSVVVAIAALPLGPTGKVDRAALARRTPEEERSGGEEDFAAPRNPAEEMMAGIWSRILHRTGIGIHDDFFELGGHSLLATQLISRIRELFGVGLELRAVFQTPTVAALAACCQRARQTDQGALSAPPITRRPQDRSSPGDGVPLSFAQQRLWFLAQLESEVAAYNIPLVLRARGPLDRSAFAAALTEIVRRHEILRTRFGGRPRGEPCQVICEPAPFPLPLADLTALDEESRAHELGRLARDEAVRPFDLARGPLLRAALLRAGASQHVLLLNLHHIVSDGWSIGIFQRELRVLYQAFATGEPATDSPRVLPELPIQYADFAFWQRQWLQGEVLASQLTYWKEQLAGLPEELELPTDRPRPPMQSLRGATLNLRLPAALVRELAELSRQHGTTLFMTLLAAFQALLGRYSGRCDLAVGSPIANRNRAEIEHLLGFFVNTLVLRGDLRGDPSFRELLARVRDVALGAYAHQDLPFEKLVEELEPERRLSHNPLVQVFLALHDAPAVIRELAPGLAVELDAVRTGQAKFDLTLALEQAVGELRGELEYSTDLFDATTIRRMAAHLESLLRGVVTDPEQRLRQLPLLPPAERWQLVGEWNDHRATAAEDLLLHELFAVRAAVVPDAVALVAAERRLSYHELNRRANRLAHSLRVRGVARNLEAPEALIGICMEPSPELVVGLLAILKAGGAFVPLDPSYPEERLAFMIRDTELSVLVTEERLRAQLPEHTAATICVDAEAQNLRGHSAADPPRAAAPQSLAYLIYTSGSTGRPKGVAISHGALAGHCRSIGRQLALQGADRVLQSASFNFDVALEQTFPALLCGGQVVLAGRDLWLPSQLSERLNAFAITIADLPAAYWQQWVETSPAADAEPLRLLRLVSVGGDVMPAAAACRWRRTPMAAVPLLNAYGPTEATITATIFPVPGVAPERPEGDKWEVPPEGDKWKVPIGRPLAGRSLRILDRHGAPVPIGVPGELCLGGQLLACGYRKRPALTAEHFVPDPFTGESDRRSAPSPTADRRRGGRLYRTGDLARYRSDGNVDFLGRLDEQVKVRGFRIELGEIEAVLAACPGVRESAVVVRETGRAPGDRELVAYLVGEPVAAGELRRLLRERLPPAMVPAAFPTLEALPRLPNGKVDRVALGRRALPEALMSEQGFFSGSSWTQTLTGSGLRAVVRARSIERGIATPRDPVEELLVGIWGDVLGASAGDRIGVHDNFFDLGGHSLLATQVISRIRDLWGVELELRSIFETPTIAGLAARCRMANRAAGGIHAPPPLVPMPDRLREAPLSFAQQRLWFLAQLEPEVAAYNMPLLLRARGPLHRAALAGALSEIVRRHEALRTRFVGRPEGEPYQVICEPAPLPLPVADLSALDRESGERELERLTREEAARPFDLARGPLLRGTLLRAGASDHVVLLNMHHIVSDGWSIGIFQRELGLLYETLATGAPASGVLPELRIQYAEYASWQRQWLRGEVLAAQLAYWKAELAGLPGELELPTDRPRPAVPSYRGAAYQTTLPASLTEPLKALSRHEGVTLYMILLAAFQVLLHGTTRQDDLAVGSPVANRNHSEIEGLIGFFVNTLLLRTQLAEAPGSGPASFRELLARVREKALGAYAHQDLPFEKLVEELEPERSLSRQPLFQVMFVLQNAPERELELAGLHLSSLAIDVGTSRFDLTFILAERAGALYAWLEYSTELFDLTTIRRFLSHYRILLEGVVADPGRRLAEVSLLSPAEQHQVLVAWNDTAAPYPQERIHQRFTAQAKRTPERVAVTFGVEAVSYREIERRSNRLAHILQELGVGPEVPVGVAFERSIELIEAILAVFKAGGFLVSLDLALPENRLALILDDAAVGIILSRRDFVAQLPPHGAHTVFLDALDALPKTRERDRERAAAADNLACLIYTSGSTGRPKGIAMAHRMLSNLIAWQLRSTAPLRATQPDDGLRTLQFAPLSFDVFFQETFSTLCSGGTLTLLSDDERRDPVRLMGVLAAQKIERLFLPFVALQQLCEAAAEAPPRALREVITAGEQLQVSRPVERFFTAAECTLENQY